MKYQRQGRNGYGPRLDSLIDSNEVIQAIIEIDTHFFRIL